MSGGPGQLGLLVDQGLLTDLEVVHFRLGRRQRGLHRGVDVHGLVLLHPPAGADGLELVGGGFARRHRLVALRRRHRFGGGVVGQGGVDGLGRGPGQLGRIIAEDLAGVGSELAGRRSYHDLRAGGSGIEARPGDGLGAVRPGLGGGGSALVDPEDGPHILLDGHRAGEHLRASPAHGHLVGARGQDELLGPEDVVVEFVAVSDEVIRLLAVHQDRGPASAFDLQQAEGPLDGLTLGHQVEAHLRVLARLGIDLLGLRREAVVVHRDGVFAGGHEQVPGVVADGGSVQEDVGFGRADPDLHPRLLGKRRHAEDHHQQQG